MLSRIRTPRIGGRRETATLFRLAGTALAMALAAASAHAADATTTALAPVEGPGVIAIGSLLTFGGTNAPDTYSAPTTFGPTPVLVDNGAVRIWQEQVVTGSNGEWDIFHMETTNGGPLAGTFDRHWDILMNFIISKPAFLDGVVTQFLVNGSPVKPTGNIGALCCVMASNPILPGYSYYNTAITSLLAGTQTQWRQLVADPYSMLATAGIDPNTANGLVFAWHLTLQALPVVNGVISASDFGALPTFAPGSWIEIYGSNLSNLTQLWSGSDFVGVNAPVQLLHSSVTVAGQNAFVQYVSPTQINVQVPGGVAPGPQPLVVTNELGPSVPFAVTVEPTVLALLAPASFKIGSTQYPEALFLDGAYVLPPGAIPGVSSRRARPGDTIILYATGLGPVHPAVPAGQIDLQTNTLDTPLICTIGDHQAAVDYQGLAPTFVGLYQINLKVPAVVPVGDAVALVCSQNMAAGKQTLSLAIGN